MSINHVGGNHHAQHTHHARHSHAARTQETNSQQEWAPRISDVSKGDRDTFEREPLYAKYNLGNGQNVIYGGHIGGDRETNSSEPVEKKETYIIQYEKPKPVSTPPEVIYSEEPKPMPGWGHIADKIPVTNYEKLQMKLYEMSKEPHPLTEEQLAKFTELCRLSSVESLREQGIKVNTGDTPEERQNYEDRLNAAINGTSSTTASEPPIYKSSDEVKQEFAADASNYLADAAAKIINGDEGASLSSLGINSSDFVDIILESFGSFYHSSDDFATLMKQSEDLIREFAKQISDGKEPDFNSLATELTINGENKTMSQLTSTSATEIAQVQDVSEEETKTPLTNSEKIDALMRELCKEPVSEERNAKISQLSLYHATEVLKERGIAVVSDNKHMGYLNGTESAEEFLKSISSTTASEAPIYKSSTEVKQEFAADASRFLANAAAKIINGDEGASLSSLGVNSSDFVDIILDSFGSFYHSSDDFATLMKQSEDLIREFAKQISDGKKPDFNSLATELTINGENRTVEKLFN